jgi:hypothetical protein
MSKEHGGSFLDAQALLHYTMSTKVSANMIG